MNCPNCGNPNSANSAFCMFCGNKLEESTTADEQEIFEVGEPTATVPETETIAFSAAEESFMPPFPAEEDTSPFYEEASAETETMPYSEADHGKTFCPSCGTETAGTKKCPVCGKKHSHGGLIAAVVILAVLFAAVTAAGAYLFFLNSEAQEALTARDATIAELESSVSSLEETVSVQNDALTAAEVALTDSTNTITKMEEEFELLSSKAAAYTELCELLKTDAIGSKSEVFFADKEYVFVSLTELDKTVTVNAKWDEASSITTEYSSDAATLEFPEEFKTTAQLKVVPQNVGITVVTFSNSTNADTFTLAIVVTE